MKPVLLGGVGMKHYHSREIFHKLADASHYPVALLPDAKGMFSGRGKPRGAGLGWDKGAVLCSGVKVSGFAHCVLGWGMGSMLVSSHS